METRNPRLSIPVDPDVKDRLTEMAKQERRTLAVLVAILIDEALAARGQKASGAA